MIIQTMLASLAAAVVFGLPTEAASNGRDKWWESPFGMFQTNLREIDMDMDVEATADFIKEYGSTAWLTSVGGILANYPTELDYQIINPLLKDRPGGDLVQETLNAARSRDIRLLARMDFSKVQLPVAEAHPEWLYISPNGTWQNHTNNVVSVCPSGNWYQERIFDILDEVMEKYELDGFFVNWAGFNENDYFRVYHGVCHCESCQKAWDEYSNGAELPDGPEDANYDDWKTWSDGVIDEWTGRVRDRIAEKLPDAGLILGESSDIMFYEANNAIDREIWHHETSQTVSRFKSHRPEVPVLVNCASFIDHAYRITMEEPHHFIQYHLQAMSRGANPSTYIIGVPGKIPWPGFEGASQLMQFHKQHHDIYQGLKPISKTALVLPQESQMNETHYELEAMPEYKGLYKTLQELHIPFDVVDQKYIGEIAENNGFERYEVLILPSLGRMYDSDVEIIDEWVAAGGTLIVTGDVGAEEDGTLQLQSVPASRVAENITDPDDLWSMYIAPVQNRTENHYYQGPIIPLLGSYRLYEWKDGAEGMYKKLDYAPFAPPEYIFGNVQVDERGVGIASHEDGKGVLFPMPVGWGYREIGMSAFRDFFELVLGEIGAAEPLKFNFSPHVEVTVNRNAERTVVHLINMSGIRYQNFGQHLPIPAGSITIVNGGNKVQARSLRGGQKLKIEEDQIMVPGIDLFDVIVIEGV